MNKPSVNLICASLLTGVYDVNRNNLVATDEFSLVKEWYDSIVGIVPVALQIKYCVIEISWGVLF